MAESKSVKADKTGRTVMILVCVLAAAAVGMLAALCLTGKAGKTVFAPPPFEENAVSGTPEVPEELGYSSPYKEGMSYRFSVCGSVIAEGSDAVVYLTNPAENTVWLKLRVLDGNGRTLGETGIIKPGEYVRCVTLASVPAAGTKIRLKIMGYEPETYESAGSATLNTTMGGASE